MKSATLLALSGVALGQGAERVQRSGVTDLQSRVEAIERTYLIKSQLGAERAAYAATTSKTAEMYNALQNTQQNTADAQASMQSAMDAMQAELMTSYDALSNNVDEQIHNMSTMAAAATQAMHDAMSNQASTLNSQMTATVESVDAKVDSMTSVVANCQKMGKYHKASDNSCQPYDMLRLTRQTGTSCSADGQIRVNTVNNNVEVCKSNMWVAPMPVVHYAMQTGDHGIDNGWMNRQINVNKRFAETYIRITYSDTGRMHTWGTGWCQLTIRPCDRNGNGCTTCSNPGDMRMGRHTWHYAGWISNDYTPFAYTGLCRRYGSTDIGVGNWRFRMYIQANADADHGWGTHTTMTADEVYKA